MNNAKGNELLWISLGIILLCVVGALDYITGPELSFSLFYLIPIAVVSTGVNWKYGFIMALTAGAVWFLVDSVAGMSYSSPFVHYWNSAIRLSFFLILVFLLRLRQTLEIEKDMARTDFVTGTYNARYFHELAQSEIERSARYTHTIATAFIDVDNFKFINDKFGHSVGDEALSTIAANLLESFRKTDIVARVGGDEFVILMPETGAEAAKTVITKLQFNLLQEMSRHNWPITFSIGVLIFNSMPESADEMLNMADQVMYTVKNSGKNNVCYAVYPGIQVLENTIDQPQISSSQ